jgi:hypothetical protein
MIIAKGIFRMRSRKKVRGTMPVQIGRKRAPSCPKERRPARDMDRRLVITTRVGECDAQSHRTNTVGAVLCKEGVQENSGPFFQQFPDCLFALDGTEILCRFCLKER